MKLADVQHQLQQLKERLDEEVEARYTHEEQMLMGRVEDLKEEFRELLTELRRKKAGDGILSEDVSAGTWPCYILLGWAVVMMAAS